MKIIHLTDAQYKQGFASFLDAIGANWSKTDDGIAFAVENVKEAFLLGFQFGEFYKDDNNY